MPETKLNLFAPSLPPMRLVDPPRQVSTTSGLAPLRRGLFCLAALALPVLGMTLADKVHRAGPAGAMQAAAGSLVPSGGSAAAHPTVTRLAREAGSTALPPAGLILRASLPTDPSSPR
ncbi:hypothetical protein [Methylobacterium planeticum]|uniref:Uncharacterized protein n=1 Tax=Methylobacterium planeticum TaxID=2615211 RepID=A0A6N6N065_9HYPH|nr:hypothetical protein [Methylobacterium planeticum]KAB1075535.1 hypothetical protein F6X51_02295 [Methylobacterium planeticum]